MEKTARDSKKSRDKEVTKDKAMALASTSTDPQPTGKGTSKIAKAKASMDRMKSQVSEARKNPIPVTISKDVDEVKDSSPTSAEKKALKRKNDQVMFYFQ